MPCKHCRAAVLFCWRERGVFAFCFVQVEGGVGDRMATGRAATNTSCCNTRATCAERLSFQRP
eukprot:1161210-Pelagomonas_calceolata.AAC.14